MHETARRLREICQRLARPTKAVANPSDLVDCDDLLRDRGYTAEECGRLASELAKDFRVVAAAEGCQLQTVERCFGPAIKQVTVLSRQRDARLIQDVMASFQQRPLHHRVVGGNPVTKQRWELLHAKGRGRGRQRPTRKA